MSSKEEEECLIIFTIFRNQYNFDYLKNWMILIFYFF